MDGTEYIEAGTKLKIDDKEYIIKNPGVKSLPDMFMVLKSFRGMMNTKPGEEIDFNNALSVMDKEGLKSLSCLIESSLKKSYPDWSDDARDQFGFKYSMQLLPIMIAISGDAEGASKQKIDIISKLNQSSK